MKKSLLFLSILLCIIGISWGQKLQKTSFTNYKLNTNECLGLVYHTGSQIYIPENAFENVENKKVTIKYREFHDKVDMIVNQIPMRTVNGEQLISGGMFEIYAEVNGKRVKLAKDKKITVRLAGLKNSENLNTYLFDPVKKAWKTIQNTFTDIRVRQKEDDSELWGGSASIVGANGEVFDDEEDFFDDWCDGCEMENFRQYDSLRFEVFKSMGIEEMGLYNYDKVLDEADAVPMAAKFNISNDKKAKILEVFVVYDELNTVISYYGEKPANFVLLDRKDIRIFTILKDGRVANLPIESLQNLTIASLKDKKHTFELIAEPKAPATRKELASLTKITQ